MSYDGFISYSHAADDLLAPRLQAGLQRFAKPWWKRRASRVFRDASSLSANPHLWSSITAALDSSEWFVLLLSPDAAASPWVNQEIEYWKTHKDPHRILPVLTNGSFGWVDGDVTGSAVPGELRGAFGEEPRWVDLRFAKEEENLDLKDPRFADAVADIASALRGIPKDELASEEVKQHRRTVRTAWGAAALVGFLAIAATVFAIQSAANAERADANAIAEAQARAQADRNAQLAGAREFAASAIAVLDRDPELATLLALYAIEQTPEGVEQPREVINALWRAGGSNRLVELWETAPQANLDLSPDGTRLAVTAEPQVLQMLDTSTGEILWSYTEDTVDSFNYVDVAADGRVAMSVLDSASPYARTVEEDTDSSSSRIVILDEMGAAIQTIEYPECQSRQQPVWSPDGRFLAVSSEDTPVCAREGADFWIEVFDTETWERAAFLPTGVEWGPRPAWDDHGVLYALTWPILAFEPETFAPRPIGEVAGMGDISPDGSSLVLTNLKEPPAGGPFPVFLVDATTGTVRDVLYNGDDPVHPYTGVVITSDGRYAILSTVGSNTFIYDMATSREVFRLPTGRASASAFDPLKERLYTSGTEPGIRVWDLRESRVGVSPTGSLGEYGWVNANSFVSGPNLVAVDTFNVAEELWAAQLFDPASGELAGEPVLNSTRGRPLFNGKFVFIEESETGSQGPVLFDPETRSQTELLPCATPVSDQGGPFCADEGGPRIWHVVVPVEGDRILAYGDSGVLDFEFSGHFRLLEASTGRVLEAADPGVASEADPLRKLDEVGRHTVVEAPILTQDWIFGLTDFEGGVGAYDLATGEVLYQDPLGLIFEATPDARLISYFSKGLTVSIVDTSTWTEIARIEAAGRVRGQAFNANGSLFAMGDASALQIVDVASGLVVQQMQLPGVSDIYFIDDETIVVGTTAGVFGVVSLSTEDFLRATRDRLRRTFTDQECHSYRIEPCPTLEEMRSR